MSPKIIGKQCKWYRLSADQGNADAQFFLANMYSQGSGVTQDYREATKWNRLAAQQGMARAQLTLGVAYYGGEDGLAQDYLCLLYTSRCV